MVDRLGRCGNRIAKLLSKVFLNYHYLTLDGALITTLQLTPI